MKMSPVVTFLVVLSVAVNIAVAVGFVVLAENQGRQNASAVAEQARVSMAEHKSALIACRSANVNRTQDSAVWAYLLQVPHTATPAHKAEIAHLRGLVAAKNALRDCATLYSVKP